MRSLRKTYLFREIINGVGKETLEERLMEAASKIGLIIISN